MNSKIINFDTKDANYIYDVNNDAHIPTSSFGCSFNLANPIRNLKKILLNVLKYQYNL